MSTRHTPEIEHADGSSQPPRLAELTLLDALDLDERPTFVINLDAANVSLELVYCNPALAQATELLAKIGGQERDSTTTLFSDTQQTHKDFREWVLGLIDVLKDDGVRRGNAYMFAGYIWSFTTLGCLKMVSGVQHIWPRAGRTHSFPLKYGPAVENLHRRPRKRPQMEIVPVPMLPTPTHSPTLQHNSYDYTLDPPPIKMSDHIRYFRSVDWAHTLLGPMSS